jgi:YidC/Oxa1 family membrane protein insertase
MMSSEQRNLFLAIGLSLAILLGFQFFMPHHVEPPKAPPQQTAEQARQQPAPAAPGQGTLPIAPGAPNVAAPPAREEVLTRAPRVRIDTPRVRGSISLAGGRIDDLVLKDYRQTTDPDSAPIVLLEPPATDNPYFAEFGFVAASSDVTLPPADAVWRSDRTKIGSGETATLTWENGQGLRFTRQISIDANYMFTVTQRVENSTDAAISLNPYGLISRGGTPTTEGFYILHEGMLGVLGGTLQEHKYSDLQEEGKIEQRSEGGWLGITDKYWLTTLIPDQKRPFTGGFRHAKAGEYDKYQVDFLAEPITVPAGGAAEAVDRFFAGAKEVSLLDSYGEQLSLPSFDKAIDFGLFYWITKPLFYVLHTFYKWLGNLGLAILLLTICVKTAFFPLANKSYRAMSKMKKLTPEMTKLREKYGDDRQRLNQELMALYKKEKANPAAGCLPIVVQIPVFFALYKVLYVSIEMRHAPFFGWIHDLSAPDPTTVFNLFGLLPWTPPHISFLHIGAWPLLMGVTMFLQQKLNPQPTDPIQAKVFMLMPIFFTFLLAKFAAGLVIYWTWNNILSITQQWIIMKRMGVKNPAA